ncbi:hypothetical protein HZB60_12625 [candidate division KSB1 bacterium]|nr:hypothetical protein [candidate division KSB1 bacterium]
MIESLTVSADTIYQSQQTTLSCIASDPDGDSLAYRWFSADGSFNPQATRPFVNWRYAGTLASRDTVSRTVHLTVIANGDSVSANTQPIIIFNGDLWNDTGEPFIDEWDDGGYNGQWDPGEVFFDLPTSYNGPFAPRLLVSLNNRYDPPNGYFDEFELFTYFPSSDSTPDPRFPVLYSWEEVRYGIRNFGSEWINLGQDSTGTAVYMHWIDVRSTWIDRRHDGVFNMPIQ